MHAMVYHGMEGKWDPYEVYMPKEKVFVKSQRRSGVLMMQLCIS